MQDEARHVAFGRLALREYYPQLSDGERDEREEFVVEACYHMRDRFNQREVWETLGLPVEECIQATLQSDQMKQFRTRLFTRIVPTVKDIGLWGPRVQKAYADMGVLDFATIDAEALALASTASSPDVLLTSARERAAAAQLDDARVQVKPTYSWVAAYQFRGGLDPMVMGGFAVRLPVWKDRKQEHAIAAAANEHTAAEHDREAAEVEAKASARELATDVAAIDVRLRFYREAIIPQSAAAFDAAEAALASGRAAMFVALDDFERWIDARREEIALSARRVASVASLEAMTGMLLFDLPASGGVQ